MMDFEEIRQPDGTIEVTMSGKPLVCTVCGHTRYHERHSLLNTRGGEFFGVAWANKAATNFVCANCGYIFWFML